MFDTALNIQGLVALWKVGAARIGPAGYLLNEISIAQACEDLPAGQPAQVLAIHDEDEAMREPPATVSLTPAKISQCAAGQGCNTKPEELWGSEGWITLESKRPKYRQDRYAEPVWCTLSICWQRANRREGSL